MLRSNKQKYPDIPPGLSGTAAEGMWEKMNPEDNNHFDTNLSATPATTNKLKDIFANNCVLYFPFNGLRNQRG